MSNIIRNITSVAMHIIDEYISHNSVVIDATCGNGHDTIRLAEKQPRYLYAFDIQETAVNNTKSLLKSCGFSDALKNGAIRLIADSHENIPKYVNIPVTAAVFNLGYLPGSDKRKTTHCDSTLRAVSDCLDILEKDGIISITMYSGHPEGAKEKEVLLSFAEDLDSSLYHVLFISMPNQHSNPPETLFITKKL